VFDIWLNANHRHFVSILLQKKVPLQYSWDKTHWNNYGFPMHVREHRKSLELKVVTDPRGVVTFWRTKC
jgi:hypothetical protein